MKHTHEYVRVKPEAYRPNRLTWFKCAVIGCTHKIKKEFIEGRLSICYRCEKEFVITKKHTELAKPHCDSCTDSDKQRDLNKLQKMFED